VRRRTSCWFVIGWMAATASGAWPQPAAVAAPRLETLNGYKVLHVAGSPEDMGRQHGRLLKAEIRRMLKDLVLPDASSYEQSRYARTRAGAAVMDRYIPEPFRRELRALADEAQVDYLDLVAAQLHGDIARASTSSYSSDYSRTYCSSYAVFGDATSDGQCLVGRNFDFWDNGIMEYGAAIIHFRPTDGLAHISITWAGIINGWTLMNEKGIVTANNTSYGGRSNSLEGISTCFMLRKVAQFASTVDEGVRIVEQGPRACGTNQIIAGGTPAGAAVVEFDHENVAVRWAELGAICADNSFYLLYTDRWRSERSSAATGGTAAPNTYPSYPSSRSTYRSSRFDRLTQLIEKHYGAVDETMNFAGYEGVPMSSINLHSAMLAPSRLAFACAMGESAYTRPYRRYRMTPTGIVSDEDGGRGPLFAWQEPDDDGRARARDDDGQAKPRVGRPATKDVGLPEE